MPTLTSPGDVVRARRLELHLTREVLAVEADVSVATIVRLENHGRIPKHKLLVRIAARLGLDPDQLADGADPSP